jgi:hypothetical protein
MDFLLDVRLNDFNEGSGALRAASIRLKLRWCCILATAYRLSYCPIENAGQLDAEVKTFA